MGKMTYEELEALCERMSKRIKKLEGDKMDKALDCYSLREVARLNARIRALEKMLSDERDAAAQVMCNEESAVAERDELRDRLKAAEDGLKAVEELIDNSEGVYGLHLNGDVSPWRELREGGEFEEWLNDFDAALAKYEQIGRK